MTPAGATNMAAVRVNSSLSLPGVPRVASMNLASPLLSGAARAAEPDSVAFLLRVSDSAGFAGDDIPDGWLGMLMSGLAGLAAALAIAIMLAVFLRMEERS